MDPLHSIIQSLNQSEKRYFKLFASAFKNESQQVRLFDAMCGLEAYDEKTIRSKTRIENITAAKVSLRKLLFKAMRNYQEDIDTNQQLRDALSDIDFLERKGMRAEALKEIKKAWKIAERAEAHACLSELIIYSARLLDPMTKLESIHEQFAAFKEGQDRALSFFTELQKSRLLNRYIITRMRSASFESPDEVDNFVESVSKEAESMLQNTSSPHARIILLNTLAVSTGDEALAIKLYEDIAKLYDDNEALKLSNPTSYLNALNNYLVRVCVAEYGSLPRSLFQKIETFMTACEEYFKYYPDTLTYYRQNLNGNKLVYIRTNKDWNMLPELEKEVKLHVQMGEKTLKVMCVLQTTQIIASFYDMRKYDKSLEWINTYYSLDAAKTVKPLMFCVRLFEVLALYQKSDYDQSDTKASNLYKSMMQQKLSDEYYRHLGTMLRRLNHWTLQRTKDRREIEKLIAEFKRLKAEENSFYILFMSNLRPDELLLDILNSWTAKSKHAVRP